MRLPCCLAPGACWCRWRVGWLRATAACGPSPCTGTTMPCAPGRQAMGERSQCIPPSPRKAWSIACVCWPSIWPRSCWPRRWVNWNCLPTRWSPGLEPTTRCCPIPSARGRESTRRLNASRPAWARRPCVCPCSARTTGLSGCSIGTAIWHTARARPPQVPACRCPPGCWRCRCVWRNASTGRITRGRCNCCWGLTVWRVVGGTAAARGAMPRRSTCSVTTGLPAAPMPACCGCFSSDWRGTRRRGSCMGTLAEASAMNTPSRSLPDYAELRCISNFTFLRGASHPHELVERAHALGYRALALTDECSLAGAVRAHVAAKSVGLHLLLGAQFRVQPRAADGAPCVLVVLAQNLQGYGNLCAFITRLRRASEKGAYHLAQADLTGVALADCLVLLCPERHSTDTQLLALGRWALGQFTGRCWVGVEQLRRLDDELWLHRLRTLSELTALPLVAVGDVHMHVRSRKPLQDVLTATRIGKPLTECGHALQRSAEQHLRTRLRLAQTFPAELLAETLRVAQRCHFSLDTLKYQYPDEVVPRGHTAASYLRQMTYPGAGRRWPQGIAAPVQALIEHELALICELRYEHYFLTVYDIVAFARSQNILCQGRGSAANSVVCYCLGVTEVDPARMSVLFERFISKERNEPPDIDIDFEHERREEVIQYLYQKYGRDRAALTAAVISYRPKSAIRDVGKALGFDLATVDAIAKGQKWFDGAGVRPERFAELGIPADDLAVRQLITLTQQLLGFPRHLSQHTGGFVLTQGPLCRMVPVENASMPHRTVIEWDKDDLDAAGLLKVDVLVLRMLSAIHRERELIGLRRGQVFRM